MDLHEIERKPLDVGKFYFAHRLRCSYSQSGYFEDLPFDEDLTSSDDEIISPLASSRLSKEWGKSEGSGTYISWRNSRCDLVYSVTKTRMEEAQFDLMIMSYKKPPSKNLSQLCALDKQNSARTPLSRSSMKARNGSGEPCGQGKYGTDFGISSGRARRLSGAKRNLSSEFSSILLSLGISDSEDESHTPAPLFPLVKVRSFEISPNTLKEASEAKGFNAAKPRSLTTTNLPVQFNSGLVVLCPPLQPTCQYQLQPLVKETAPEMVVIPKGAWHFTEGISNVVDNDRFRVFVLCLTKGTCKEISLESMTVFTVLYCRCNQVMVDIEGKKTTLKNWDTLLLQAQTKAVIYNKSKKCIAKVQLTCSK